jgi:hypothetical protein
MTHPVDLGQVMESLREIRTEQVTQGKDLASVKESLHSIVGNGQPGRLQLVEADVKDLRDWKNHSRGWFAGLSAAAAVLGAVGHWIVDSIRHK